MITPDQKGGEGIAASRILEKLPPRLDPHHVNDRPELPASIGDFVSRVSLELRLFVLPDGSVGTAEIVRSCGQHEINELALNSVKNDWRYLRPPSTASPSRNGPTPSSASRREGRNKPLSASLLGA